MSSKVKSKRKIKKPTKIINEKIYNMHHPDFYGKIEFAFEAEGVKYYNFARDTDMRYARYIFMQDFLQEVNLRATIDTLKEENKIITSNLDLSKGKIDLAKALEVLSIQRQRLDLAFEPDTVYRLASCLYFDETEILTTWDKSHNERKIAVWKESHTIDFFSHRLFQELTGLKDLSPGVLTSYLQKVPGVLKGWSLLTDTLSR